MKTIKKSLALPDHNDPTLLADDTFSVGASFSARRTNDARHVTIYMRSLTLVSRRATKNDGDPLVALNLSPEAAERMAASLTAYAALARSMSHNHAPGT